MDEVALETQTYYYTHSEIKQHRYYSTFLFKKKFVNTYIHTYKHTYLMLSKTFARIAKASL